HLLSYDRLFFFVLTRPLPISTLFPYTTLFRSVKLTEGSNYTNPYAINQMKYAAQAGLNVNIYHYANFSNKSQAQSEANYLLKVRSEEHTSELQSRFDLVCRLLLEKKKTKKQKS